MKGVTSHITNTLNQEPNLDGLVKVVCKYRNLSIVHFNVRSLSKNKRILEELL